MLAVDEYLTVFYRTLSGPKSQSADETIFLFSRVVASQVQPIIIRNTEMTFSETVKDKQ